MGKRRTKKELKNLECVKAHYREMRLAGFVRVGYWVRSEHKEIVDTRVRQYTLTIADARFEIKRKEAELKRKK